MSRSKAKFRQSFDRYACVGDTIEVKVGKFTITARIEFDEIHGAPWDEEDGHGPVSDWTTRAKRPGEVVLHSDRSSYRYYDWQEAIAIAKKDGWNAPPYDEGTKGQRAARAVKADFDALRAWCRDDWHLCGIVLSVSKADIVLDNHAASLWGIECNYPGSDNSYLTDVANELLAEAIEAGQAAVEKVSA